MASPKLDIVPVADRARDKRREQAIEVLRAVLRDAEEGNVDGVLIIVDCDGTPVRWAGSGATDRWEMAGKLEYLKLRMLDDRG